MADYTFDYPLPDPGTPPPTTHELVRQIAVEGLMDTSPFTGWTWEQKVLGGSPVWVLVLLPNGTRRRTFAVLEQAVVAEDDPDKALVLAWRYRGRKKETMRALAAVTT